MLSKVEKNRAKVRAWRAANTDKHKAYMQERYLRKHPAIPVVRPCVVCLAEFTTLHPSQLYCSKRCRRKAYYRRVYGVPGTKVKPTPPQSTCCLCGVVFARKNGKYCSIKCHGLATRKYTTPEVARRERQRRYKERIKHTEYGKKRRYAGKSTRIGNGGTPYTYAQELHLLGAQRHKCAICMRDIGVGLYERDHIMPLSLGGTLGIDNIQLTCPACNRMKGYLHPVEFSMFFEPPVSYEVIPAFN